MIRKGPGTWAPPSGPARGRLEPGAQASGALGLASALWGCRLSSARPRPGEILRGSPCLAALTQQFSNPESKNWLRLQAWRRLPEGGS